MNKKVFRDIYLTQLLALNLVSRILIEETLTLYGPGAQMTGTLLC